MSEEEDLFESTRRVSCSAPLLPRVFVDCAMPLGSHWAGPGEGSGQFFCFPSTFRKDLLSVCQAGRSREPDTSLRWDGEAPWLRQPAGAAKFFADFPEFLLLLPRTDGTRLSSTGLPHRSLGLVPPNPARAARGRGRGGGDGAGGQRFPGAPRDVT